MQQQITSLLDKAAFKIGTLRKANELFSDRLAPHFNIFDYLRTDEMGLSRCISSLLDPTGKHGQGGVFLKEFLMYIDKENAEVADINWEEAVTHGCQVTLEKQANGKRRIDVYLRFQNGEIIGIENKPWASDQENQLKDYADFIQKEAGTENWLLIYLCNGDPSKSEYSITEDKRKKLEQTGNFIWLDYAKIIEWLEFCSKNAKALVVRVFIEELAKFVRLEINGELDMSEEKEMKSLILESTRNLESAFHVFKAIKSVKEELIKTFHEDLKVRLIEEKYELIWDESTSNDWKSYFGFGIKFKSEQNLYLRFEFSSPKLNGLYWGIKRENEQINNDASLWNEIRGLMNEFGAAKQSERWPWWNWINTGQEFGSDFMNWDSSETPWLCMMPDREVEDKLVEKLINLATRVEVLFKNHTNPNLLSEGVLKQ